MKNLACGGIVCTCGSTANIRLMRPVARESDQATSIEYRPGDHPVRQMIAPGYIWVVENKDVLIRQFLAESAEQRSNRETATTCVDRYAVSLRHN